MRLCEQVELERIAFMLDQLVRYGVSDEWGGFPCQAEVCAVDFGELRRGERR